MVRRASWQQRMKYQMLLTCVSSIHTQNIYHFRIFFLNFIQTQNRAYGNCITQISRKFYNTWNNLQWFVSALVIYSISIATVCHVTCDFSPGNDQIKSKIRKGIKYIAWRIKHIEIMEMNDWSKTQFLIRLKWWWWYLPWYHQLCAYKNEKRWKPAFESQSNRDLSTFNECVTSFSFSFLCSFFFFACYKFWTQAVFVEFFHRLIVGACWSTSQKWVWALKKARKRRLCQLTCYCSAYFVLIFILRVLFDGWWSFLSFVVFVFFSSSSYS